MQYDKPIGGAPMSKIEDISLIIRSFSEITGAGICFYDLKNFFMYTSAEVREYTGHRCSLCTNVRALPGGQKKCDLSDRGDAVNYALRQKTPFFHQCHIGLYELLVPIYNGNTLCGLVFVGQCRIEGMNAEAAIEKNAAKLGANGEQFKEMYLKLPVLKSETLFAMGNVIKLYLENLIDLDNIFARNEARQDTTSKAPLHQRVKSYIDSYYQTHLSPQSLSERFFVNSSYLSRTFKEKVGTNICTYINQTRVEHAKALLKDSHYPISAVALNVGYTDANYFVKIFRKFTGMTPSAYRQSQQ